MQCAEEDVAPRSRLRKLFRKPKGPESKESEPSKSWINLRAPFRRPTFDHTEDWSKEIQRIQNDSARCREILPVTTLQAVANFHLVRDETLTQIEWNTHLSDLVRSSAAKRAALLSCAHLLDRETVRKLLLTLLDAEYSTASVVVFLQLLPFVRVANPTAVDEVEIIWSKSLEDLVTSTIDKLTEHLLVINQFLDRLLLNPLLEPPATAIIKRSSSLLLDELNSSRAELRWIAWGRRSEALSRLAESALSSTLASVNPEWKSWAIWCPNKQRLNSWSGLSGQDVLSFKDLLELDGPDFENRTHGTMRSSCSATGGSRFDALIIAHDASDPTRSDQDLESLLSLLDRIVSMGPRALASFRDFYKRRPVPCEDVKKLTAAAETRVDEVFCTVSHILTSQNDSTALTGVIRAIPLLSTGSNLPLREMIAPRFVQIVKANLDLLQSRLCNTITHKRDPHVVISRMSDLASSLSNANWLTDLLDSKAKSDIETIPDPASIGTLLKIYERYSGLTTNSSTPLLDILNEYILAQFGGLQGSVGTDILVESLVSIWNGPVNRERRELAYGIATSVAVPMVRRAQCLQGILNSPEDVMTDELMEKLKDTLCTTMEDGFPKLIRLILARKLPVDTSFRCWHDLLCWMLEEQGNKVGCKIYSVEEWFLFIDDLTTISQMWENKLSCNHPLLQPVMLSWSQELRNRHLAALKRLEQRMISITDLQWVLRASCHSNVVISCLELLNPSETRVLNPVVEVMLEILAKNGSKITTFCATLALLDVASEGCGRLCLRMCEVWRESSKGTAEYFVNFWLQRSSWGVEDRAALRACASGLGLHLDLDRRILIGHQYAAKVQLLSDFGKIKAEIEGIDTLWRTLRTHNAAQTSALVRSIGVTFSELPRGSTDIPYTLVSVVEKIAENELELFYPLTHLKPLQRVAMGIGDARGLIIRVRLRPTDLKFAFCMHLHPDEHSGKERHTKREAHDYWEISQSSRSKATRSTHRDSLPNASICYGKPERVKYQVSRTLHRYLAKEGLTCSIEELYNFILARIGDLANCCIVCGQPCPALWRSTTCQSSCSVQWRQAPLEIRLMDLRDDPMVIDLLLTMIYSAAKSNKDSLLRDCPLQKTLVAQTINTIPALSTLQNAPNLSQAITNLGRSAETILSWATHSYRGFLTSATGNLKIPNMPGVTQFVLACPNPEHQAAFTRSGSLGRVVFHGTSLDRLYSILCESLKSLSGTALQRVGASMGRGIYLADDPSQSMHYAETYSHNWTGSSFSNLRILLGCELVGSPSERTRGIYVIPNMNLVAVRYIFVCGPHAIVPERRLIEAPMLSAYAAIRSGIA